MKAKGIRAERETVVCFNEEDALASIWTASETVYRRLRKLGYDPAEDNERSAVFAMPKRDIKLPRPKSEKRSQASRRRSEASQTSSFSPGTTNRAIVQPPNASKTYKGVREGQLSQLKGEKGLKT